LTRIDAYVGYDVDTFSIGAQIVGVAHHLPFGDHTFDSVLCTQVLEHVEQPWLVLDEIARILKPGGKLVLSVPQAWRLHEVPHDYFRYTRYGLQSLLQRARLELQCCTPQGGAWLLIGQTVNNHLWRNTPARGSLTWVLSRTFGTFATTLINLVCAGLDAAFPDTDDTLNYVAIAHKP
jgi:SAM-dependent methyltransferase